MLGTRILLDRRLEAPWLMITGDSLAIRQINLWKEWSLKRHAAATLAAESYMEKCFSLVYNFALVALHVESSRCMWRPWTPLYHYCRIIIIRFIIVIAIVIGIIIIIITVISQGRSPGA